MFQLVLFLNIFPRLTTDATSSVVYVIVIIYNNRIINKQRSYTRVTDRVIANLEIRISVGTLRFATSIDTPFVKCYTYKNIYVEYFIQDFLAMCIDSLKAKTIILKKLSTYRLRFYKKKKIDNNV